MQICLQFEAGLLSLPGMKTQMIFFYVAASVLFAFSAEAQIRVPTTVSPKEAPQFSQDLAPGWTPSGTLGLNLSFASSDHVVGQPNGTSQTYGLQINASYNFRSDLQEWQNTIDYAGATTKNPSQNRFVKSRDELKFESLYLFKIPANPKLGPYAKVSAKAPVFFGEDVRTGSTNYVIQNTNGTSTTISGVSSLRLTDGWKPLTTRESVGAFWRATETPSVRVDLRLGLGAEQVSASGQRAVSGVGADGSVQVQALRDVTQLGVEAAAVAKGQFDERSEWMASVETLTPFASNKPAGDRRDAIRLTTIDGTARITNTIASWLKVSYDYKLTLQPQLVDVVQQSHLIVLNIQSKLF